MFKEKLTSDFKYDMMNLMNFHPTSQKSENIFWMGPFFQSVEGLSYKNTKELSFLTLNSDPNFNKPWPFGLKTGVWNWVNFHYSPQKSEKLYFDELFLSKVYNVSARKFHMYYASWHWRVMQNLTTDSWLEKWQGIWLILCKQSKVLKYALQWFLLSKAYDTEERCRV